GFLFFAIIFLYHKYPINTFGKEDFFFSMLMIVGILSYFINKHAYEEGKGITQLLNFFATYVLFKVSLLILINSKLDSESVFRKIFTINSILQVFALIIFLLGLFNDSVLNHVAALFNNSGNFNIGAIGVTLTTARSF